MLRDFSLNGRIRLDTIPNLQIYVISLLRSPDRRANAAKELAAMPYSWEFLDAVDGSKFASAAREYDKGRVMRLLGFELTNSEIGCFLSHKKAWSKCVENGCPTLIFEDDFAIKNNFMEALDIAINKFTSWEIFRLQGLADSGHTEIASFGANKIVKNLADPLGSTAYIVTPNSARVLLQKSSAIFEPLDHFLEHKKYHGLQVYALKPYPVGVSGDSSTIIDRPELRRVRGFRKIERSFFRILDRLTNRDPWFGK
jgi:glycosyl transferase, family 25